MFTRETWHHLQMSFLWLIVFARTIELDIKTNETFGESYSIWVGWGIVWLIWHCHFIHLAAESSMFEAVDQKYFIEPNRFNNYGWNHNCVLFMVVNLIACF